MNGDSAYRVETAPRLAQWKIDGLSSSTYRKSDPFRMGLWNWHLTVERSKQVTIRLYPETSALTRDRPPVASFVIRDVVLCPTGARQTLVHPGVRDKKIKGNEDFVWSIDGVITGKFLVDVEFLDLKTGEEPSSIWSQNQIEKSSISTALTALGRMLADGIHTDITINTADGSIEAHRAILAARSPVFCSMFSHNLQEKELSAVHIPDMSLDACSALLNYVYGNVRQEEFVAHRLDLLRAAEKYDVADLKSACEESLVEDVDSKNVLERLQSAHLFGLPLLKSSCMRFLVKFGKIHEIRDDLNEFLQSSDRELVAEVFQAILDAWKGF